MCSAALFKSIAKTMYLKGLQMFEALLFCSTYVVKTCYLLYVEQKCFLLIKSKAYAVGRWILIYSIIIAFDYIQLLPPPEKWKSTLLCELQPCDVTCRSNIENKAHQFHRLS